MPIIPTRIWLKHLYNETNEKQQRKTLPPFNGLMKHNPHWELEEWLHFLYGQGLLPVGNGAKEAWIKWQNMRPSKGYKRLYTRLMELFKGPDVDVFLFPVNEKKENIMKVMNGKNGITLGTFILLFFHGDLSIKEKQALLIHEYHHVCRLHHQKNTEESVTLLESMVMEGLAEWEVKRLLGEGYVSNWMTTHKREDLLMWWNRSIKNRIDLRGRKHHVSIVYGGKHGYPKWLGYGIGYRMVESYMENYTGKEPSPYQLLKTSPKEILKGSLFRDDVQKNP